VRIGAVAARATACAVRPVAASVLVVLVGLAVLAGSAPAPAAGEVGYPTPTPQASAIHSEFLIDPTRPPAADAAVCEVDSGIADWALADFAPGQVTRYALDGGPITDTDTTTPDSPHGTTMAEIMGAQPNGIGMVGIWPGVKIVSVRALYGREQGFRYGFYKSSIAFCLRLLAAGVPIAVINLSLGGDESPSTADVALLENAVDSARRRGVIVLAAAGNQSGPVMSPAREDGVVSVGATDAASGEQCANTPVAPTDLLAPGCGLRWAAKNNVEWQGWGTSHASAVAAALIAAGRAYRPTATVAQVEAVIRSDRRLDAARFFRALGIGGLDGSTDTSVGPSEASAGPGRPKFQRPLVGRKRRRGRLLMVTVRPGTRPAGASLYVRALNGRRKAVARVLSRGIGRATVRLPASARWVDVRYRDRTGRFGDSPSLRWRVLVR